MGRDRSGRPSGSLRDPATRRCAHLAYCQRNARARGGHVSCAKGGARLVTGNTRADPARRGGSHRGAHAVGVKGGAGSTDQRCITSPRKCGAPEGGRRFRFTTDHRANSGDGMVGRLRSTAVVSMTRRCATPELRSRGMWRFAAGPSHSNDPTLHRGAARRAAWKQVK